MSDRRLIDEQVRRARNELLVRRHCSSGRLAGARGRAFQDPAIYDSLEQPVACNKRLGPGTSQCLDLRFHKINSHGLSHGQLTSPGMFLAINDLLLKQDLLLVEGEVSQTKNLEGIVPISDKTESAYGEACGRDRSRSGHESAPGDMAQERAS